MTRSTVFISSRMDELSPERRSAFNAIYLNGFTPLLFETEPIREEKRRIDDMVDQSSIFVGIYYQSIGEKAADLYNLEPIAYELYRFLARYSDPLIKIYTKSRNACKTEVKELLDKLLKPEAQAETRGEPSDGVRELLRRVEAGDLDDVLQDRVFLYFKKHSYDAPVSVQLVEMLRPFHAHLNSFQSESSATTRTNVNSEHQQSIQLYKTARFKLFGLIDEAANAAHQRDLDLSRLTDSRTRCHWHLKGPDHRGLLYQVLEILFRRSFNIDLICSGKPVAPEDGDESEVIIDVVAHPFITPEATQDGRSWLTRQKDIIDFQIRKVFKDWDGREVELTSENINWDSWPHTADYKPQEDGVFFSIETADVPGQIVRLTEKIYAYDGNIDLLYFDSRSQNQSHVVGRGARRNEKLLAVSWPDEEDPLTSVKFATEVRQGLGVMGIREMSHKSFFERLEIVRRSSKVLMSE